MLAPCFAFGALLALHQKNIPINGGMAVVSWLLYFIFRDVTAAHYFFYLAIFLNILFLSSTPLLMALKPSSDISCGIYLWGFPTQQILAHHFLHLGIRFNQVAAIFISIILGYLSWQLVEKRAIKFGHVLTQRLSDPEGLMVAGHNAYTPGETQRPN
jgi:peptidoglycan/LPS O-acetylase OafA/YrhL